MKVKLTIALIALFSQFIIAQPDKKTAIMTYTGHYTGQSIFIKNQYPVKGVGFGIHQVKINGQVSTANLNSEMFEVALDHPYLNLKRGDNVTIEIKYVVEDMPRVTPTILNPGALLNEQNFKNTKEDHLVVEGKFYHVHLYITNFYNTLEKTHSIKQVIVNGKIFDAKLDRDVVTVDLYSLAEQTDSNGKKLDGYKEGDPLKIELTCEKGANPIILNGDLITPFTEK